MIQNQYISNWRDSFVNYINLLLGLIASLMDCPGITSKDKVGLDSIKLLLRGKDASDVEKDLAAGIVRKSTLDKIEKLDKDLTEICLEHIESVFLREFLRKMVFIQIEHNKQAEEMRLSVLKIPIIEE